MNKSEIKQLLKRIHGGDINSIIEYKKNYPKHHWEELKYPQTGDTVLHIAARLGYVEICEYLLQHYEPNAVNCRNNDNKTALHDAAQFAQHKTAKILLAHGADVNALKKADWTPLMLACTKIQPYESIKMINLLLEYDAIVNYPNKDGWTVLHLIAREGSLELLNILLKHQLDVNKRSNNGRTALHIAALHGHMEIVDELMKCGLEIDCVDNSGNTPLHEAILNGNLAVIQCILAHKPNLYAFNEIGFTILHFAASAGHLDVIKFILEDLQFDVDLHLKSMTALHCAARKRDRAAYHLLIELGADASIQDNHGRLAEDLIG